MSGTTWKNCSGCPLDSGGTICQCLENELPSIYSGMNVSRNNPLIYTDKPDLAQASAIPLFNTMSDVEERARMRAVLADTQLRPNDQELFIDRVLYKDTFKELANRYGLRCARTAKRRFDTIKAYLKEVKK